MKRVLVAIALLASSGVQGASLGDDAGRYVVTRVVINPLLDARQRQYVTDDPRLVGRFVDVAPRRLALDGTSPCTRVGRTTKRGTVADLLRSNLPPASPARQRPLRFVERGLDHVTGPVAIVRYRCLVADTGRVGGPPGRSWTGAASFPIGQRQRGLFWQTEAILILTPVTGAAPRPSFDCRKARGAGETAICRDPSLASWDRSLAAAYALLRDGGGPDDVAPATDPAELAASQRRFLAERSRCGADRTCLSDRMSERVEALMRRRYGADAS